ncbi:MAG: glutamate synthase large subunit, partial [Rickettsiales bacterium]
MKIGKLMSKIRQQKEGLYDPKNEHDACGIGFVANIKGIKSHSIVNNGLEMLENLEHRGAVGSDKSVGDGAGILTQIPDEYFRDILIKSRVKMPAFGNYGVAMIFFPKEQKLIKQCKKIIKDILKVYDLEVFFERSVPVNNKILSKVMIESAPDIRQLFIKHKKEKIVSEKLNTKLFLLGKMITNKITFAAKKNIFLNNFYICSMSTTTINYKGMLLSDLVRKYFLDLNNKSYKSNFSLIHQRFSTNTFPSWDLAQPFKMICHNGEINTVRGNVNWINARKLRMSSKVLGKDLNKIWPLIRLGQSDSACFDSALELLVMGGYSIAEAMMLLIPEAWQNSKLIDRDKKAFYQYHSLFSEPWDGPAAIAFTDGKQIGATLDRNGLRPARYFITDDDRIILSSEMGVLRVPENKILEKFRLRPGKMLLVDLETGRIIKDNELKKQIISKKNYKKIIDQNLLSLENIKLDKKSANKIVNDMQFFQNTFGYTEEDIKFLIEPMLANKAEATGSMGTDTPVAILSDKEKLLFNYFKQNFAQVTNPAIDPIREETVMSLFTYLGSRANLLNLEVDTEKRIFLKQPVLNGTDLMKIEQLSKKDPENFRLKRIDITFDIDDEFKVVKKKLKTIIELAESLVKNKKTKIIILSDKNISTKSVAFPSLLALSAVHHHLIKKGLRTDCSIVVETAEAREVHHYCVLGGYGAEAIYPYLALETVHELAKSFKQENKNNYLKLEKNYISAIGKGILKVMSKMGISTYQSYNGAQIFDAVGLNTKFIEEYFSGTASLIQGAGFQEIIKESKNRHRIALINKEEKKNKLEVGGEYAYRIKGENHVWDPDSISSLQHAIRSDNKIKYKEYANYVNGDRIGTLNPRSLFSIKKSKKKVNLKDVESAEKIVKRFSTGAMSFGSISREAHTTLAIAMNSLGGRSNTGEGGEERDRYKLRKNGDNLKSAIKQVASGRFGVTTEYLVNSTDIQIKVAQGAKPGEGGQLPGHKVDKVIADVRFSTPGVGLISPPPHHDIYSIEDLAQLIFDLKNVNPKARISVKLVSEIGVGTVAAGVAKSKADHITISGFEGGTGASPLTSIKHAGSPWELGLAETQQTLILNNLRSRISLQVDGGLRTGRDVIIGALLGADEFGFSTAPLISIGCIMMRKCHLNTCPVGIATQRPELRKKFQGKPDHV